MRLDCVQKKTDRLLIQNLNIDVTSMSIKSRRRLIYFVAGMNDKGSCCIATVVNAFRSVWGHSELCGSSSVQTQSGEIGTFLLLRWISLYLTMCICSFLFSILNGCRSDGRCRLVLSVRFNHVVVFNRRMVVACMARVLQFRLLHYLRRDGPNARIA